MTNKAIRPKPALILLIVLVFLAPVVVLNRNKIRAAIKTIPFVQQSVGQKTIAEQLDHYGVTARIRWAPIFQSRGLAYPPSKTVLVAIKDKYVVHAYAAGDDGKFKYLKTYPVLGASGALGPKLKEGDGQVPEGIYALTPEPNTPYHLALRLNYPNEYDLARAQEDGRQNPGSDILVHGSNCSIGCIAMGDPAAEDLFVLACDSTDKAVPLIVSPVDFRNQPAPDIKNAPSWLNDLYSKLRLELAKYPAAETL